MGVGRGGRREPYEEEGVGVRRVCFVLHVRADRLEEYRERHQKVWPEMLDALSGAGWRNYSLFLGDDGLLVGYLETEDFEAARAAMDSTGVNARWQAEMAPFFDVGRPDQGLLQLAEVFHLD